MRVHEAVAKEAGEVLRCSLEGCDAGRWLELPAWMLDRVSCAQMRIEGRLCVDARLAHSAGEAARRARATPQ